MSRGRRRREVAQADLFRAEKAAAAEASKAAKAEKAAAAEASKAAKAEKAAAADNKADNA